MAFRRMRRSKSSISFSTLIEATTSSPRYLGTPPAARPRGQDTPVRFRHSFEIGTKGYSIRAEFSVVREHLTIEMRSHQEWVVAAEVTRNAKGELLVVQTPEMTRQLRLFDLSYLQHFQSRQQTVGPAELFATTIGRYAFGTATLVGAMHRIRVFQISPTRSREFGVPLPRPELEGTGANLPAVVDLLKKERPKEWRSILAAMRAILPRLNDISVDYTSMRTLGLLFHEDGVGRPWSVGEVSDGTIQALALLVAIFDARFSLLVLEEPENSVHPWIIRRLMEACEVAAESRQILITTHSPLVINSVAPDSLFGIWRHRGETHLAPLTDLDSSFRGAWNEGRVPTFDYLDSGAVPEVLPPAPDSDGDEGR